MMKGQKMLIGVWALALLAAAAVSLSQAQVPEPDKVAVPEGASSPAGTEGIVTHDIPIQGRLTDAAGNPVPDGVYTIAFRLYNADVGGNLLCEDTETPTLTGGLFAVLMGPCTAAAINGQELWLELQVEGDGPMLPRQQIAPVPYAFSLRPGARIYGEVGGDSILYALNSSTVAGSTGIVGYAAGLNGVTFGVSGYSLSPDGYGGYFCAGNGLLAVGITGVAIRAGGTGRIQSSANSYLWISGNSLQKANSDDTTRWQYDDYGGYKVYGGSDWGTLKRVVLPVTIPGQLYGQNVTVSGLDLYHARQGDFAKIDAVIVRRQDGVGTGNLILYDDTDLLCTPGAQCSKHWTLTQNNVLSAERGILHIVLRFAYGGESDYIQIGGVRLTLEHD